MLEAKFPKSVVGESCSGDLTENWKLH